MFSIYYFSQLLKCLLTTGSCITLTKASAQTEITKIFFWSLLRPVLKNIKRRKEKIHLWPGHTQISGTRCCPTFTTRLRWPDHELISGRLLKLDPLLQGHINMNSKTHKYQQYEQWLKRSDNPGNSNSNTATRIWSRAPTRMRQSAQLRDSSKRCWSGNFFPRILLTFFW